MSIGEQQTDALTGARGQRQQDKHYSGGFHPAHHSSIRSAKAIPKVKGKVGKGQEGKSYSA